MKIIIEILKRILGIFFCSCLAIAGLMLFFGGIILCTTLIGIIIGVPLMFYGFALTIAVIAGGFQIAVFGKIKSNPFKKLETIKEQKTIIAPEKFNVKTAKFVSLSPAVENYELN